MGLKNELEKLMTWTETKKFGKFIKQSAVQQLLRVYHKMMLRPSDTLKYGDELEYLLVQFDEHDQKVGLVMEGKRLYEILENQRNAGTDMAGQWTLEYGMFMIESTPKRPFEGLASLGYVEKSMAERRQEALAWLPAHRKIVTVSSFPRLGCSESLVDSQHFSTNGPLMNSIFLPDATITPTLRFKTALVKSSVDQPINVQRQQPAFGEHGIVVTKNCTKEYPNAACPTARIPPDAPFVVTIARPRRYIAVTANYGNLRGMTRSCSTAKRNIWSFNMVMQKQCRPTLHNRAMTRNANARRGSKMSINIPIFQDQRTGQKSVESGNDAIDTVASQKRCVYMDSMVFANGCCSLQVTLQAKDFEQLKMFYDQFGALAPILKALSASSPIFRGYLVDTDTRWRVISQGTDDRTVEERDAKLPNANSVSPRCSSIRSFVSAEGLKYNDVPFPVDEEVKTMLLDKGMDEGFAIHVANTFSRDPMLMFEEKLKVDDDHDTFHFESVQALNYQSVRFKLPPPHVDMGWRIELRVCDVQLTDFENAAFVTFVVLLSKLISQEGFNVLMPISKVDENTIEADMTDAVRQGKFWCRVQSNVSPATGNPLIEKMSMNDIINGREGKFIGLVPMIRRLFKSVDVSEYTRLQVERHLTLISRRASGDYLTTAQWIRNFVRSHRDYNNDSVVSDSIAYDLMMTCENIASGVVEDPRILKRKGHRHSYLKS